MDIKAKPSPTTVLEEHTNRVFQLYEAKAKSFRTSFATLLGFALGFFFLVQLPYISIESANHRIGLRLQGLPSEIASAQSRIDTFHQAQAGVQKLRDQIQAGPSRLRRFIGNLAVAPVIGDSASPVFPQLGALPPTPNLPGTGFQSQSGVPSPIQAPMDSPIQGPVEPDPCRSLSATREDWINCTVEKEVLRQFSEHQQLLDQQVIAPLRNLQGEQSNLIDVEVLEKGIQNLLSSFRAKLSSNPRFWRTVEGKGEFSVELDNEVTKFWEEFGSVIDSQTRNLESHIATLQSAKADLERQQAQLKTEEGRVAERLSQIEFPLGKLPLALNETVAAFPFLLAIGFLVCASLLAETIRLRREFHRFYQKKDAAKSILSDEQISLVAPLWIDPADPQQNRVTRFALLLLPLFICLVACGLIAYRWTLPETFAVANRLNRWIYAGLYVISLGIFGYAWRRITGELRSYSVAPVSEIAAQ